MNEFFGDTDSDDSSYIPRSTCKARTLIFRRCCGPSVRARVTVCKALPYAALVVIFDDTWLLQSAFHSCRGECVTTTGTFASVQDVFVRGIWVSCDHGTMRCLRPVFPTPFTKTVFKVLKKQRVLALEPFLCGFGGVSRTCDTFRAFSFHNRFHKELGVDFAHADFLERRNGSLAWVGLGHHHCGHGHTQTSKQVSKHVVSQYTTAVHERVY